MRWLARNWPVVAWAVVIWIMSTHWFTGANTSRIIVPVLHWMFPHASMAALLRAHHYIRKSGHCIEYFIFSLLLLRTIRNKQPGWNYRWALVAILIVFAYAALDEFHQSFVPGRGPAFSDVLLDTAAGAVAQLVSILWAVLT